MEKYRNSIRQFLKFGIVGGSGTIVNLVITVLAKKISWWTAQISEHDVAMNLFGSQFNIRWFNIFAIIAFLVANLWNFLINRMWTFKAHGGGSWFKEFFSFLLAGIGALCVTQIMLVLLMNPTSPLALPSGIFDDSTGFRTKFYWASALSIIVAMPVNFIINKLWTFRGHKVVATEDPS